MKRYIRHILGGCLLLSPTALFSQNCIYVSADANTVPDGTEKRPYPSLEQALKSAVLSSAGDTVHIMVSPGDYLIDRPISISATIRRPIVISGKGGTRPRFIGGITIGGWTKLSGNIYQTQLPRVNGKPIHIEQLFINGRRAIAARTPNEGWLQIEDFEGQANRDAQGKSVRFDKKTQSLLLRLNREQLSGAHFRFLEKWDAMDWSGASIHNNKKNIVFHNSEMHPWNKVQKGSRCIISHLYSALDAPGEWFSDEDKGLIYYIPRTGEDMMHAEIIAPVINRLICIEGAHRRCVNAVTLENLSFLYCSHGMSFSGDAPEQAAANLGASIELSNASHITISDCMITGTGGYGIWLKENCQSCVVENCVLTDMGAGGIKIGVTNMSNPHTTNTIIRNNTITDIGNENPCGAGILVLNASNSTITHNEISYTYYSGISCGWTWGYNNESRTNPCTGNIISYNYIHHIGRGMLSDLGGIYTLGEQPGTVIENNVIHDVQSYDYGGIGIYTDEGSSHITIRNNLVYRCSDAGYEHNYGRDNIIENNIFAFNGKWQLLWVNQEPTVPFTFRRNIIIHDCGTTLNGCMSWREGNAKMSHNLYWHTGGRLDFASLNFSTWRDRHDRGSVEADPLFVNARGGDFRFRSTAAARRIDFKPFDYSLAGVYGPMKSTVHSSQPSAPQPSTSGTIHFPF